MTFYDAMERLIKEPAWSVKIGRQSDEATVLIMDFTGVVAYGPKQSDNKADYLKALIVTKHLIEADNWYIYATDCKWKE